MSIFFICFYFCLFVVLCVLWCDNLWSSTSIMLPMLVHLIWEGKKQQINCVWFTNLFSNKNKLSSDVFLMNFAFISFVFKFYRFQHFCLIVVANLCVGIESFKCRKWLESNFSLLFKHCLRCRWTEDQNIINKDDGLLSWWAAKFSELTLKKMYVSQPKTIMFWACEWMD